MWNLNYFIINWLQLYSLIKILALLSLVRRLVISSAIITSTGIFSTRLQECLLVLWVSLLQSCCILLCLN